MRPWLLACANLPSSKCAPPPPKTRNVQCRSELCLPRAGRVARSTRKSSGPSLVCSQAPRRRHGHTRYCVRRCRGRIKCSKGCGDSWSAGDSLKSGRSVGADPPAPRALRYDRFDAKTSPKYPKMPTKSKCGRFFWVFGWHLVPQASADCNRQEGILGVGRLFLLAAQNLIVFRGTGSVSPACHGGHGGDPEAR